MKIFIYSAEFMGVDCRLSELVRESTRMRKINIWSIKSDLTLRTNCLLQMGSKANIFSFKESVTSTSIHVREEERYVSGGKQFMIDSIQARHQDLLYGVTHSRFIGSYSFLRSFFFSYFPYLKVRSTWSKECSDQHSPLRCKSA